MVSVAALVLALAVMTILYLRVPRPEDHPLTRLTVDLGPDSVPTRALSAAISPDGRRIVFPERGPDGIQRLATRLLDQTEATALPGTENGENPFLSPDGKWIGFSTNAQLEKISVQGGAPLKLDRSRPVGHGPAGDGSVQSHIAAGAEAQLPTIRELIGSVSILGPSAGN